MVEGKTEDVFKGYLIGFLKTRFPSGGRMPKVHFDRFDGRIPKEGRLQRRVNLYLNDHSDPADHVIALTDVYTGTDDFQNAPDAKNQMRAWVGNDPRFHPHVALHDFEAWLLPFWDEIQRKSGSNRASPGPHPELVNHHNPPSKRIEEAFRTGRGRCYVKTRDALAILKGKDLLVSANACPELKAFLNTLLQLAGGQPIP
jgi:hypothetical protein